MASGGLSGDLRKCRHTVRSNIARASGYATVSLLALTAVIFDGIALVSFALVAIIASVLGDGRVFRLFADRAEFRSGRLVGLVEYAAIATVLAAAVFLEWFPRPLFTGVVLLVGIGYFGAELARLARSDRLTETTGFITVGFVAYTGGHIIGAGLSISDLATIGLLAMAGALVGAMFRAAWWARHDGIIMFVLAVILFGLFSLEAPTTETVVIAIVTSIALAYLALLIRAASITGMVTGVLMVFLTIVYGGLSWVLMLVAFFGIGGLATKYKYADKRTRGVAEANRGARGSGNVLGNTIVALVALLGFAATSGDLGLVFAFAFAGAIATALSDTLSSEIGGLYDDPMMITSFERVAPGTDGAVSVPGTGAGIVGAGVVAAIFVATGPAGILGGVVVTVAGTLGMLTDSLLGAVLENRLVGNHSVNTAATFTGATLSAVVVFVGLI